MFKQADIVIVKFPFTDGSEFKKRPALIISNDMVNQTGDYLMVQITSKINNDGLSLAIKEDDCLVKLPLKSFIRTHKIFTIHQSLLLSKLTEIRPEFLTLVTNKIGELIRS